MRLSEQEEIDWLYSTQPELVFPRRLSQSWLKQRAADIHPDHVPALLAALRAQGWDEEAIATRAMPHIERMESRRRYLSSKHRTYVRHRLIEREYRRRRDAERFDRLGPDEPEAEDLAPEEPDVDAAADVLVSPAPEPSNEPAPRSMSPQPAPAPASGDAVDAGRLRMWQRRMWER